jgi:putative ABC transport system permease protein
MRWYQRFFRRRLTEKRLEDELHFHLDQQVTDYVAAGLAPEEARRRARLEFGGLEQVKEACREVGAAHFIETLVQDVRYGVRMLRKNPGFTVVAVLTLALGMGANTAIFSLADQLLLRPLPFPEADRLVSPCYRSSPSSDVYNASVSFPDYIFYRDQSTTLAGLAVYTDIEDAFRLGDQRVRIPGEIVSSNYFSVLGVSPFLGRWFLPDEDAAPGRNPVVVLGYALWQRAFGSDPAVLGRRVVINGASFTIVGIAPRNFAGWRLDRATKPEFWVPTMMYRVAVPEMARWDLQHVVGAQWLSSVGRLKAGVTIAQAQTDFAYRLEQLKQTLWRDVFTKTDNPMQYVGMLVPANEARIDPASRKTVRTFLTMLMAVAGLVLLIACSNVASLMLSRAHKRQSEMGVRLALGAGRRRLFQQLLTESLLITFAGGGAGLMLAIAAAKFLASFHQPFHMPLLLEPQLDFRVLAFTFVLASSISLLFGLLPLRQGMRVDLVSVVKGDSGALPGRSRLGMQPFLIAGQVAISVILMIGAILFVRTLRNAEAADPTRDPGSVLLLKVDLTERKYDEARGKQFYSELLARVHSLPAVHSAALVYVVPMGGWRGGNDVIAHPGDKPAQVDFNIVSDEYFQTVGLPLVRGRNFNAGDRDGSPNVAIINEQMALKFWPGQDPIGKQIGLENPTRMAEIIGIVRDGRFRNYRASIQPCFYVPFSQEYEGRMSLEVRAAGGPMRLDAPVRRQIHDLDEELVIGDVWTLESFRDAGLGQERTSAALLSAFGVLAVALAGIGLYGVLAFSVARRTHEIGIRMALGASRGNVLKLVTQQGMALTLAGLAAGLIAAFGLTRWVASALYGVQPFDHGTFIGSAVFVGLVALGASYLPARRAARVDPIVALRHE